MTIAFTVNGLCHGTGTFPAGGHVIVQNRHGTFYRVVMDTIGTQWQDQLQHIYWRKSTGETVVLWAGRIGGGGAVLEAFEDGTLVAAWCNAGGTRILTWPNVAANQTPVSHAYGPGPAKFFSAKSEVEREFYLIGGASAGLSGVWQRFDLDALARPGANASLTSALSFGAGASAESLQYLHCEVIDGEVFVFGCNADTASGNLNYCNTWLLWACDPHSALPAWASGQSPVGSPVDVSLAGPATKMLRPVDAANGNNFLVAATVHAGRAYAAYVTNSVRGGKFLDRDDMSRCPLSIVSCDAKGGTWAMTESDAIRQRPLKGTNGNVIRAVSGSFTRRGGDLFFITSDERSDLVVFKLDAGRFVEASRAALPTSTREQFPHYIQTPQEVAGAAAPIPGVMVLPQCTPQQWANSSGPQGSNPDAVFATFEVAT